MAYHFYNQNSHHLKSLPETEDTIPFPFSINSLPKDSSGFYCIGIFATDISFFFYDFEEDTVGVIHSTD